MAWLNTAVADPTVTSAHRVTRAQSMREQGVARLPLPSLSAGAHVVDHLFDVGPSVPTGMGEAPIGYADIAAWQAVTGIVVEPWEALTLRQLSRAYVTERNRAHDVNAPAPWVEVPDDRAALSKRLGAALSAMAHAQPRATR